MSATAVQDNSIIYVPFNSLTLSDANIRKVSPTAIEGLADSILAEGVIQNLVVVPSKKKKGLNTYGVVAGKRRFLAMTLLLNEGKITSDYEVPVLVKNRDSAAISSVIENLQREKMHPVDEFKAFKLLADEGMSVQEISLRSGTSERGVRQRLCLGSASPELLDECLAGNITLEQLMVLSQIDDHDKQNALWFNTPNGWQREPHNLRKLINGEVIYVSDKLVKFVGLEEYQAQGGVVSFDLFEPDDKSIIEDRSLLEGLATAKLTDAAKDLGWSWFEVAIDEDYSFTNGFSRTYQEARDMTDAENEQWELWEKRYAELEEMLEGLLESYGEDDEHQGSVITDTQKQIEQLDEVMSAFHQGLLGWHDKKSYAGVYVALSSSGEPRFIEGLVKKEDVKNLKDNKRNGVYDYQRSAADDNGGNTDHGVKLSNSLNEYLASVRASSLQAELIKNQRIGLVLLCHSLTLTTFYRYWSAHKQLAIEVESHSDTLGKHSLEDLPSSVFISELFAEWQAKMPEEGELLSFLLTLDDSQLISLAVFCASFGLKLHTCTDDSQIRYAILSSLLGVKLTDYWQPTADNFFNRLNRPVIAHALSSAGVGTEGITDKMKKAEVAARAGDLIKQNPAWLPDILRVGEVV